MVLQRVSNARVIIDNKVHGKISKGLVLLIGVANTDTEEDVNYCVNKCVDMRIFENENNKMNRSVLEVKGEILVISQFTLLGNTRKGRRPSFINAAVPQKGNDFYELFIKQCWKLCLHEAIGVSSVYWRIKFFGQRRKNILQ